MGGDRLLRRTDAGVPRGKLIRGVRALYQGPPTLADIEQAGLTLDSDEIKTPNPDGWFYTGKEWRCVLWAANWPAIQFYNKWSSQWRVAPCMSGIHYIALDMGVILQLLDRLDLTKDEYDDMLGCLREIEAEAKRHLNAA